jgi:hypothetical protein
MRPNNKAARLRVSVACVALNLVSAGAQTAHAGDKPARISAASIPQLIDITASTGIRFSHLSAPEAKYVVESMSGGVAIIDYDGDGWPDIYFTNAPSVEMALAGKRAASALFRNNHDGTFSDVTAKAGVGDPCWAMGAAVGDYDNDGLPDLLVSCFGGVVLYRNNGDGTFRNMTRQAGLAGDAAWATGAAFGDYDGDGWSDLFVAHYVDYSLKDLPAFGSKATCKYFGIDVQCGPRGLKGSPDNLYHNNHDGTFTDVSRQAGVDDAKNFFGLSALWTDFDGDGFLDLFVANDGGPNYLYQNDGHGHFTEIGYQAGVAVDLDGKEQANMGLALGDYQHKGRQSVVISHFNQEYAALYRNDGALNFVDVSQESGIAHSSVSYVGWGDAFLDLDNDGWADLIVANGHVYPQVDTRDIGTRYRQPKLLFLNQRNGSFRDISKLAGEAVQVPQVSRGLAVADLFNDGHLEVVVENLEGQPAILKVESGTHNHWISLALQGVTNRLALNARVRITSGDVVQEGEVLSGGSYLSQNDLRLHFGLGTSERVNKVEVTWSRGKTETFTDLAADQYYQIRQGRSDVIRLSPLQKPGARQ